MNLAKKTMGDSDCLLLHQSVPGVHLCMERFRFLHGRIFKRT